MGRMAQTWKPWPLGPSPLTLGLDFGASWKRSRRSSAAASSYSPRL